MEPITIYRLYCLLNACWKHTIHHKEVIIIIILKRINEQYLKLNIQK